LIREAEIHADDDRKKKVLVEARNAADSLIYSTEKTLSELGNNVDHATKDQVETAIGDLKKALQSDDAAEIKRLTERLNHASHVLAKAMYQQSDQAESHGNNGTAHGRSRPGDDDVVDADYEEVA
jgi:molecular chaperone DnaK